MEINNPAFNYDKLGQEYSGYRQTDPSIFSYILKALGKAKTILNVGAGAGSYEPSGDRYVIAAEPSVVMCSQRQLKNKVPAVIASADDLPFDDNAFDASTAFVTVHHWLDMNKGLKELRRVAKDQVVIMTFDPEALDDFWNAEYFPEVIAVEKKRYPAINLIKAALGGKCEVQKIPVPLDCIDGFQEAFYGRPEAFLNKQVRRSQSAWGFISPEVEEKYIKDFAEELSSGRWDRKYGHYRTQGSFTCALRLVIATP
jgi:SAM-dependent methyltransferase